MQTTKRCKIVQYFYKNLIKRVDLRMKKVKNLQSVILNPKRFSDEMK